MLYNVEEHNVEFEGFEFWSAFAEFDPLCSVAGEHRTRHPWTRFNTTAVPLVLSSLVHNSYYLKIDPDPQQPGTQQIQIRYLKNDSGKQLVNPA